MGIFDTIGSIFGLNLETRARKAVAILMILVVVVVVLSIIDPVADEFINALFGYPDPPLNAPFTIPQIMAEVLAVWTPLAPILTYVRDSTLYGVFFILGMAFKVLGIALFGEGITNRISSLGDYFNNQRDYFGKKPEDR